MALLQLLVVQVVLLLINNNLVQSNDQTSLQLSVYPSSGHLTENLQIRCQITPSAQLSPLTTSKFENVYLLVRTDNVKPSGIILKFDDTNDRCETNDVKPVHVDVCNATLILIRMNHTLLNETLEKIDYSCTKGSVRADSSYRILKDQSARFYDPMTNGSSIVSQSFLLLFIVFQVQRKRWECC